MTNQTISTKSLRGSPTGNDRLRTLAIAALVTASCAALSYGQAAAPPVAKAASVPGQVTAGGYLIHQAIELGGRITNVSGSQPMWDTLFNQGTGGRILGQSLEMHSLNPAKTPFFDTLSTNSTGYGGDPYDVSYLKFSKGRIYDFSGSFRRDRNYFDYNQMVNSFLTTYTAAAPTLVAEPDSLHLFNTVRRNTDATLTLLPLALVSFRAGFNHGTHEGPTYSTIHNGGDVQVLNWFRNGSNTYTGGADLKLAKRTTLSYDQFYVAYKGDSSFQLAGANYPLSNGTPVSLGVDVLGGSTTCGSATAKPVSTLGPEIAGGIVNPYCSATITQSQTAPTRTGFPTEQLRFSSRYWEKVAFNGRFLYSGATSTVNSFNESFYGLGRGNVRQTIETGTGTNGQFASNKRVSTNGDFGITAELNKYISLSDAFNYSDFRNTGSIFANIETWTGSSGAAAKGATPAVPTTSILTPLNDPSIAITNAATTGVAGTLNQQTEQNTLLATVTLMPEFKVSGGWRYKNREVADSGPDDLIFHENGLLLGAVIQPNRMVRVNVNFDSMNSTAANSDTTSNTFTREAPNRSYHLRARATLKPAKWISFAVAGSDYSAKNDDPMVNHLEHNRDFSFGATVNPTEQLSLDFNYAYDDVYSRTDLCYVFTANANAPLPAGAANSGTCVNSAANPSGATNLNLGTGLYDAPSNFVSGAVNYAPRRYLHLNAGARLNDVNGSAEMLNPLVVPGALQSKILTPFADVVVNIAPQWAWHGNWIYNGYGEQGPAGPLALRNVHGNTLTLGVKYAF